MNTFNFQNLYKMPFGGGGNKAVYPDRTSSHFRINFRTPNEIREQAGFFVNDVMARFFDGTIMLRIFKGSELLYEAEDKLNCNVHPGAPLEEFTPSGEPGFTPGSAGPVGWVGDYWLEPNTDYALEVERLEGHRDRQPISVSYRGVPNRREYPELKEVEEAPPPPPPVSEDAPLTLAIEIQGLGMGTWVRNES